MAEQLLSRGAVGVIVLAGVTCLAGFWLSSPLLLVPTLLLAAALAGRLILHAIAHSRVAHMLLADSRAGIHAGVELRWRSFGAGAAVAGLRRPAIFCDPSLRHRLTASELGAVVLHERHHQVRRDPGRLLVFAAVEPLARLHPRGRGWLARRRAWIEVAADRYALDNGASRRGLAGAIVKLGDVEGSALAAGFSSAQELRLRALVHDEDLPDGRIRRGHLAATTVAAALLACGGATAHHLLLPASGGIGCLFAGC